MILPSDENGQGYSEGMFQRRFGVIRREAVKVAQSILASEILQFCDQRRNFGV